MGNLKDMVGYKLQVREVKLQILLFLVARNIVYLICSYFELIMVEMTQALSTHSAFL